DLDHEAVLDHGMADGAAGLEDVDPGLGEGPRHVLEQAVTVPAVDLDLNPEGGVRIAIPGNRSEAVGVFLEHDDVRTIVPMDGDAAPKRDIADDGVSGYRAAALRQSQRNLVYSLDRDSVAARGRRCPRAAAPGLHQVVSRGWLRGGGVTLLEALHKLVDDRLGGDLRAAEGDVEVLGLAEAHLADHVGEQRGAHNFLCGQPLLSQVLL